MELSYLDVIEDINHYRSLGANEDSLSRTEGVINHCFALMSKFSELELSYQNLKAQALSYQEIIFGESGHQDNKKKQKPKDPPPADDTPIDSGQSLNEDSPPPDNKDPQEKNSPVTADQPSNNPTKKPGHGRISEQVYTGAHTVACLHGDYKAGDICPGCQKNRLYASDPQKKIVIDGQSPFTATRYEIEILRCLCGLLFKAEAPVDTQNKYTVSAKMTLAYLHYGMGLTYYGIERMQSSQGVPIPQSTQSELVASGAGPVFAVVNHLGRVASESELLLQDDTPVRIIELIRDNRENSPKRKGMYTTGFVVKGDPPFVLYVSGRQHAGENFDDLMSDRTTENPPVRVADALNANSDHQAPAIQGKCNAHPFRKFRTLLSLFPDQCSHVLHIYGQVYDHDAFCKKQGYSPEQRLVYHQTHSQSLMDELYDWAKAKLDNRQVEPNSALGKLLQYLLNHKPGLTLFLRQAGVPIDTNEVERALKEMIRYRKRSLFFVTNHSADYGSAYMSLIATCHMHQVDAIDYLTQLQLYEPQVWQNPGLWLPWNYRENIPIDQAA